MNNLEQMKKRRNKISAIIAILVVLNLLLLLVFATSNDDNSKDGNSSGEEETVAVLDTTTLSSSTTTEVEGNPQIANVVTGANFTVALDSNGKVWAWGQNDKGQLGNGTLNDSVSKTAVLLASIDPSTNEHIQLSNVKQIAAGEYHVAALTNSGEVYVWGYNYFGQIGKDDIKKGKYPEKITIPNGTIIKQVECGADYTILVTTDGKVLGVGDSSDGQLGYYNDLSFTSIREIEELKDSANRVLPSIKEIKAGYNHIIALGNDNKVWTWGDKIGSGFEFTTISEVSGFTNNIIQIEAGNDVSMALDENGNIYTWNLGSTTATQVTLTDASGNPLVDANGNNVQVRTDKTKDNIAIVNKTYYIIDDNNKVYSWGQNAAGQTGTGNTSTVSTPKILVTNSNAEINDNIDKLASSAVAGVSSTGATSTTGQYDTAYAINEDGYVLGWGYAGTDIVDAYYTKGSNNFKLLGDGTRSVADYIGSISVKSIVSDDIILDITKAGVTAGKNQVDLMSILEDNGYITGGRVNLYRRETASKLESLQIKSVNENIASYDNVTGILTGVIEGKTTVEIKSSKNTIYINVKVIGDKFTFPKIESRNNFTVALKADGTVWAWGYNSDLGIMDSNHTHTGIIMPTQVQGLTNVKDIAVGENFVLVLKEDGTVWGWGANSNGQLGDGTKIATPSGNSNAITTVAPKLVQVQRYYMEDVTTDELIPATAPIETVQDDGSIVYTDSLGNIYNKVEEDYADSLGNIVIKKDTDGNLYKWDYTNNKFETKSVTKNVLSPKELDNVKSISAGSGYALALDADGKVWSWGSNGYGQLGLNKTTSIEAYAKEVDLSNLVDDNGNAEIIKQIEAGKITSYILTNEGNVYAFGYSGNYQCGNSSASYVLIPTKINSLSRITKISTNLNGNGSAIATTVNGKVWAWGYYAYGSYYGTPRVLGNLDNVIDIDASDYYGVAIAKFADGTVGYWSSTSLNTYVNKFTTTDGTEEFDDAMIISATSNGSASGFYTVAKSDGTVWSTGINNYGQLGNRTTTTMALPKLKDISKAYITLDKHEVTLKEAEKVQVNAIYKYGFNLLYTEKDQDMTYTSLDENIASINGNEITAIKSGKTYVIAEDAISGTKLRVEVNVLSEKETTTPDISIGYQHTVALKADGTVWGWGYNNYGELGNTTGKIGETKKLEIDGKFKDVAAGTYHTLMLTTDGKVLAMGYNGVGQLGNNTNTNSKIPVTVQKQISDSTGNVTYENLDGIVKIVAQNYTSLALDENGDMYAWGEGSNRYATKVNTYGLKVKDISGKLILTEDGRVWEYTNTRTLSFKEGLENIVQISSSSYSNSSSYGYYMALDAEGNVYTWVRHTYDRVLTSDTYTPRKVTFEAGIRIVDIEAGVNVAYAVADNGDIYSWGNYSSISGALGLGTSVTTANAPTKIDSLSNVEIISASKYSTSNRRALVEINTGSVYGFGTNGNNSLLGNGDTTSYYYVPTLIGESFAGFIDETGKEITKITLEKGKSINVKATSLDAFNLKLSNVASGIESEYDFDVFNSYLVSLSNTTKNTTTITAGSDIGEATVIATDKDTGKTAKLYIDVIVEDTLVAPKIESTENHTVALKADGTVWVWGDNSYKQLGVLNGATIKEPKQLRIAKKIEVAEPKEKIDENGDKVTDSNDKQIYVDTNGNEYYKSGNNYTDLSGILKIKNDTDSKLYAWDSSENTYKLEDLKDSGGNTIVVTDIATSKNHTLLLTTSGEVYSFGYNYNGQLGYATPTSYYGELPQKVAGLKDIVKIAVGDSYSLALDKYGRLWGFGYIHDHIDGRCHMPINSTVPTRISKIGSVNIDSYMRNAIDITNEYVLTKDGEVFSLQLRAYSLETGTKIEGITGKVIKVTKTATIGNTHTAFLTDDGNVFTIGNGTKGQLGNDTTVNSSSTTGNKYTAVQVKNKANTELANIKDVYVGNNHTMAIDRNGTIYTWGNNAYGELRNEVSQIGLNVPRAYPVKDDSRIGKAILISGGNGYTVVVDETGFAYAWGNGTRGQLGNDLTISNSEAVRVGTEGIHLDKNHVTLQEDGVSVEINAYNSQLNLIYDQSINVTTAEATDIGVATASRLDEETIKLSPVNSGVTSVIAKAKGKDNKEFESIVQVTVLPKEAELANDISVPADRIIQPMTVSGKSHTLILKSDGTVWAYGDNTWGQTAAKDSFGNIIKYSDKVTPVEFPDGTPSIIAVAAGDTFSVALDVNGDVYTWGYNKNGQLGLGVSDSNVHATPTKVSRLNNIIKVVAGANQVIALDTNGYVYSWGRNIAGSLGIGSTSDINIPKSIDNISKAIDVAAGVDHAMVLTSDGTVYTTGRNASGQLGEKDILNRSMFAKVDINAQIEYIEAGNRTSMAIDTNGKLWVWGNNEDGQLGLGIEDKVVYTPSQVTSITEKVESVSAGDTHTHIVTSNGSLYVAGSNKYGQLGIGQNIEKSNSYVKVSKLGNYVMSSNAGTTYSTMIAKDGTVYGFGDYNHGNLEKVSLTNSYEPVMISDNTSYLDEQEVVINVGSTYKVNANGRYKLNVLRKDNSTFTYESTNTEIATISEDGIITGTDIGTTTVKVTDELGKVNVVIVKVIPVGTIQAPTIEGGNKFAVVTDKNGTAYLFGNKENVTNKLLPTIINDSVSFNSVKAGEDFVVAIGNDGTVWAWGNNGNGQLGLGEIDKVDQITRLNRNQIKDVVQIDAGNKHTIALDSLGAVYVWGDNSNGQLGLDSTTVTSQLTPKTIRPVTSRVISVSAGGNYSAIVDTNGNAYILKNGGAYKIPGITGAVKVATGTESTLVLTNDGKIYVVNNETLVTLVKSSDKVMVDISANEDTYMCLSKDKKLYTFGNNKYGQMGTDGNYASSSSIRETNAEEVFTIGAGYNNTYYINTNGEVFAAGLNTSGELGNGTSGNAESTTQTLSKIYTKVGDSAVKLDPEKVRVSTEWDILVGEESLQLEAENNPKTVAVLIEKENEFNVFGNKTIDLKDYDFEITDTTKAEITDANKLKVTTKELGTTTLKITNKITKDVKELTIYIVREDLLRIDDIFIDDGASKFESSVDGDDKFLIDTEGSAVSGTLNISLTYDDNLEVIDKATGAKLTATRISDTNNWQINGLDLTKPVQELELILTTADGSQTYKFTLLVYKEAVVKVNDEILLPVEKVNKVTTKVEKVYTKFINPSDLKANIEIYIQDKESKIQLEDNNGNVLEVTEPNALLKKEVDVLNIENEFTVKILSADNKVEKQYTIRILKSSIESIYVIDTTEVPSEKLADRSEGTDGIHLEEFNAKIEDVNNPANITIDLRNKNIKAITVNGVDKTSSISNSKLVITNALSSDETKTADVEIEITAVDVVTSLEYTERYVLKIESISSNNEIDYIELTNIGPNEITPIKSRLAPDEAYAYEIVIHDPNVELDTVGIKPVTNSSKAKVSVNNGSTYREPGQVLTVTLEEKTENKYLKKIIVKAQNGDTQEYNIYIYKESENAKIDKVYTESPTDSTPRIEVAEQQLGTNSYIAKVLKDKDAYKLGIDLVDSYSEIESITIDGVEDISTLLVLNSGADGKYIYDVQKEIIGKTITVVVKAEYDKAPTETFTIVIMEMDDNANLDSINIDGRNLNIEDVMNEELKALDNGLLTVKAESDTATVEVYLDNPVTNPSATILASGKGSISEKMPIAVGDTKTLYVKVTSEDGTNTVMKELTVKRLSNNINILSINATEGSKVTYASKDTSDDSKWILEISDSITNPTINVETENNGATVTVDGVDNGTAIDISTKDSLRINVTSEDKTLSKDYTLDIKKLSSNANITKELHSETIDSSTGNTVTTVVVEDARFTKESDYVYSTSVTNNLGILKLVITPEDSKAVVKMAISKDNTGSIDEANRVYVANNLELSSDISREVVVKVTSEDGQTRVYTIKINSKHQMLNAATVTGVNANNTALDKKSLTSEQIKKGEATLTVDPTATKARIGLTVNSEYVPVSLDIAVNEGMLDEDGNSIEKKYTDQITSSSEKILTDIELVADITNNVVITFTDKNGAIETLILKIEKGSNEAILETVTLKGTTTNTEEVAEYITSTSTAYTREIATDSTDNVYRIIPKCARNATYKIYKISDENMSAVINSIDLTKETEITSNPQVILDETTQRFVIEVTAEYGGKTQRYDLYLRKISSNANLKDLTVTVDERVIKGLDDFGEVTYNAVSGTYDIDIIVPKELTDLKLSDLVVEDSRAKVEWTNIIKSTEGKTYSDYITGDLKELNGIKSSDLVEQGLRSTVKHVYIKVTAENGKDEKIYNLTIKKTTDNVDLKDMSLYNVTDSVTVDISKPDYKSEITETVKDVKVTSKSEGVVGIKVTKVNGFTVKENIATATSEMNENSLNISLTQNYTYTDENGVDKTISADEVRTIVVETTVTSKGYKLYPEYYTNKTDDEYMAKYELTITRLMSNTNIAIEVLNEDGTTKTITSSKDFVGPETIDGKIVYTYEYKVPSTQDKLVINNIKTENEYATIENGLESEKGSLYSTANPKEIPFAAKDKATIEELITVIPEIGKSVEYRLKVTKKSNNKYIGTIKLNGYEPRLDTKTTYTDTLALPINKLDLSIKDIEENALVNVYIKSLNGTDVTVTGKGVDENIRDNGLKDITKDLLNQLSQALNQVGISGSDIQEIVIKIEVTPEDRALGATEYTLYVLGEKPYLISINGLDLSGNVKTDAQLTASDFEAKSSNTFETRDIIKVPNNTSVIELTDILCELDDEVIVKDELGNVLTDRKLTVNVANSGITKVKFIVSLRNVNQEFTINIRKRTTDTSIKEVQADKNKTNILDTTLGAYVLDIESGSDPKVKVVLRDSNARVVAAKAYLVSEGDLTSATVSSIVDNEFTISGISEASHNKVEDTDTTGKTINVKVTVRAEDGNRADYIIRLNRKHTEVGLGKVEYTYGTTKQQISFANTDVISKTIPSSVEGINIISAETICGNAKVYVRYTDETGSVQKEELDATKLYTISEGTEKTFNIVVKAEYGNEKAYTLKVRRQSANADINAITVKAGTRTKNAIYDSETNLYTAEINVNEDTDILVSPADTLGKVVGTPRAYKVVDGDLSSVTISSVVNNSFAISGLADLYADDPTEDASNDENRYIYVEFNVAAEDTSVVKTHKLKLTRRHIELGVEDVSYSYTETSTSTDQTGTIVFNPDGEVIAKSSVEKVDFAKIVASCDRATVEIKVDNTVVTQTDDGFSVDLAEATTGDGAIKEVIITVTAESGATKEYKINVIRMATNASLSNVYVKGVDATKEASTEAGIEAIFKANVNDTDTSAVIRAISANVFATVSITDANYTTTPNNKTYEEVGTYDLSSITEKEVEVLITVIPQDTDIPSKTYKLIITRQYNSTILEQIKVKPAVSGETGEIVLKDNSTHTETFKEKTHIYYKWYYGNKYQDGYDYWYGCDTVYIPSNWSEISLGDILPADTTKMDVEISRIDKADPYNNAKVLENYTIDSTFTMPEGEEVYFKVITKAESGATNENKPYVITLYKKARNTNLSSIVVDGKLATLDNTDGIYKVNVNADKNTLPIIITGENKLSKANTTISVNVNGTDVTTLLGTSKSSSDEKEIIFTLNNIISALDYTDDKVIIAKISLVPEDTSIEAKEYTVQITRQHTSTNITSIVINKDSADYKVETDGTFSWNSDTERYEKRINVTSQLDTVRIDEINLECASATKVITVNGQAKTLPFDISLPNENSVATIKVEIIPEFEDAPTVERYIIVRRMYSDDSISSVTIEREYPEIKIDNDGKEYETGKKFYDRSQNIVADPTNPNNYSCNIRMDQDTTKLTLWATNSYAVINLELVDILDKAGNSIKTGNELYGQTIITTKYKPYVYPYSKVAMLNTSVGRTFVIKVKVQSEDLQVPAEEYTLTITKQDDSAEISKVIGNNDEIPVDDQITHYDFVGKTEKDGTIYTKYIDESVNEVLTKIITESEYSKIYLDGDYVNVAGVGQVEKTVAITETLTELKVRVVSEDGITAKDYRVWFIRKSADASIKELYVDGNGLEPIVTEQETYYEYEISDTVEQIDVKMIPNYEFANVSINGQSFKWQKVEEIIEHIDKYTLVNGKVKIELRVDIPASQSATGEEIEGVYYLYVNRVSTENTLESITTDNYNDGITPMDSPYSEWHNGVLGYHDTYEILLDATAEEREEIDLRIVPVSPMATVELYDLDGNIINASNGVLLAEAIPIDKEAVTTLKVKVIPQRGASAEYFIDIVPKASQAELKELTIGGRQVDLQPGKYEYKVNNLGLAGSGAVYALAKANSIYPEDSMYGSATVKIYTKDNVNGSGEQVTGQATLNDIDFENTTYVTITVVSPNGSRTQTYTLWLKDVSDDSRLEEVKYNGGQIATMNKPTDMNYIGEYVIELDPEEYNADITLIATNPLSTVTVEKHIGSKVLNVVKDLKSMDKDIVLDVIVTAESGNESKYKLTIKKRTIITGTIITENKNSYANTVVQILDNADTLITTAVTKADGTFNVEIPAGDNYKMTIKKDGYLKYTMIDIPATYGVRRYTGKAYLIAGEVAGDDEYIDIRDLVQVNRKARVNTVVDSTNDKYDFNGDGYITNEDLDILIKNYDKKAEDIKYIRVIEIFGEVLDATDTKVTNATIEINETTLTDKNGEFGFDNVQIGNYVLKVTDENGVVIGNETISIVEGDEYKIEHNVITIDPNMSLIDITVRVNGARAVVSKRGEDTDEDITLPKNVTLDAELTLSGVELTASGEDRNLDSFIFYKEDGTEIARQTVTGTTATITKTYSMVSEFNKTYKFYVEVKDSYGNMTRADVEVKDNIIKTEEDLIEFSSLVNSGTTYEGEKVTLANDLDLTGLTFTPIGKSNKQFKGNFDGSGHTISNIDINSTSTYVGLFGHTNGATIKNIGIQDGNIISTKGYVGGIVAYATDTTIEDCYNSADITSNASRVGGIVGYAKGNTVIRNCYNSGNITGINQVGGIAGQILKEVIVENCYSIGIVSGSTSVGEIVGFKEVTETNGDITTGALTNCYYLSTSTNNGVGATINESIRKQIDTTQPITDITTLLANLGESYKSDTDNLNNGYPVLKWQKKPQITTLALMSANKSEFVLPVNSSYVITSDYGTRIDPTTGEEEKFHTGLDIAAEWKTPILAIADGTVTYAGENGGYGYCIEIEHVVNGEKIYSFYAHLYEIDVQVGDTVIKGQQIALEGGKPGDAGAGTSTGAHLHFEIRKISGSYSSAVDPRNYLEF